ncbi:MAG: glycosyltransferase family 4 protein, partial [Fimbriimonadaceae bacterium]
YETVPEIMTKPFIAYLQRTVDAWLYTAEKNKSPLITHGLTTARFVKGFNAVSPASGEATGDVRRKLGMTQASVALVLASRAIHDKGWDIAIDATRQVRAVTGRDVRLILVGDGENAEAMRERAKGTSYVHFWGPTGDVAAIIGDCDLAVFPTTYSGESFPLFLLECFAGGLPVVAADVGSIREMMTTDDGAVAGAVIATNVDRGRMAKDLAAAIAELISGPEPLEAARMHARKRAEHYDTDKMARLYLEIFASLSTKRR